MSSPIWKRWRSENLNQTKTVDRSITKLWTQAFENSQQKADAFLIFQLVTTQQCEQTFQFVNKQT